MAKVDALDILGRSQENNDIAYYELVGLYFHTTDKITEHVCDCNMGTPMFQCLLCAQPKCKNINDTTTLYLHLKRKHGMMNTDHHYVHPRLDQKKLKMYTDFRSTHEMKGEINCCKKRGGVKFTKKWGLPFKPY